MPKQCTHHACGGGHGRAFWTKHVLPGVVFCQGGFGKVLCYNLARLALENQVLRDAPQFPVDKRVHHVLAELPN